MWSRAELQQFMERQRAAQSVLLADAEAALEFASARFSWDSTFQAAQGDENSSRRDRPRSSVGRSSTRGEISSQSQRNG